MAVTKTKVMMGHITLTRQTRIMLQLDVRNRDISFSQVKIDSCNCKPVQSRFS